MSPGLRVGLVLYFPFLLSAVAVFFGEFRGEGWSGPLFLPLFGLWLVDGLVCLVFGLRTLLALESTLVEGSRFWLILGGVAGVLLGLPCGFIALDLIIKLFQFLAH